MRTWIGALIILTILAAVPSEALNSGDDVLVPAVGRNRKLWRTDLYVMNPGNNTAQVTVYFLVRNQANPNPAFITLSLAAGETEVLRDVILDKFGLEVGFGGFRVVADREIIVNSRIYAADDPATYGQGSEGVPVWAATIAGQTTDVVGLSQTTDFRSNIYVQAGSGGASINFSLRDPSGVELASTTLTLEQYEPYLERVTRMFDNLGNFPDATLTATVTSGSAVIGASKVDNNSDDPTTLESRAAGAPLDGTYQISVYETTLLAAGGRLVIQDGVVVEILGTYFNGDKVDENLESECKWIMGMGDEYTAMGVYEAVQSFLPANGGVTFEDTFYDEFNNLVGHMVWTMAFTVIDNMVLEGTVDAVGSQWTGENTGCNGTFPSLMMDGGKAND
jgi:hypothetical protein